MLVEFKASATCKASLPDTIISSDKVDSSVYDMGFVNVYNVCGYSNQYRRCNILIGQLSFFILYRKIEVFISNRLY
jgi:hypothetical protein